MFITHDTGGQPSLKCFCDHCGNITFQIILDIQSGEGDFIPAIYSLTKCSICDGVALRVHPGEWPGYPSRGSSTKIDYDQLWPPTTSLTSDVPDRIRAIYKEATLIKKQSPSSFVV